MRNALVLLSGGQDSATALLWALAQPRFDEVEALSIYYGQRHKIELECAERLTDKLKVEHKVITGFDHVFKEINRNSALINEGLDVAEPSRFDAELPASFVPGRNIFFLTTAAVVASWAGINDIVMGVCQTDFSGYPDCRQRFVDSMSDTLFFGLERMINIHTPLMNLTKAQTWGLADEMRPGGANLIVEYTHTCYEGAHQDVDYNEWGFGCGSCPACKIRADGYLAWRRDA